MNKTTPSTFNKKNLRQYTQAEWDDDSAFLCDLCKKIGYCKLRRNSKATLEPVYDLQFYVKMIPLRVKNTELVKSSPFAQEHIQRALDAFHQEDYETALFNFRAISSESYSFLEITIAVTLCYFYLHDFDQAIHFIQEFDNKYYRIRKNFVDNFINICLKQIKNQKQEELEDAQVVLKDWELSVA